MMMVCMLTCSCGGPKDKEGASLKVGKQYLMTRDGLELIPFPRDRHGNRLEMGKDYRMVGDGLELITHLRDFGGNRVEIGHDYFMTEEGLRPVQSRLIEGALVDAAGKALAGMPLGLDGTTFKTTSEGNGAFRLPFVEGPLKLVLDAPELPAWCRVKTVAEGYLRREDYPGGWQLGPVGVPCIATVAADGRKVWTTPDGRFSDNGDGTVSDLRNGLMWVSEIREAESVERAAEVASSLNLGGSSDWRLPSVEELKALADTGRACVWNGPALIRGGLTAWALDNERGAAVVNLCSGEARKGSGAEPGAGPNPGILALRAMSP